MTITPKQAQELLEGTTPAPWEVETVPEMRYYDGETWETPGKIVVYADEVTLFVAADEFVGDEGDEHDNEKNVRLAATAPVLAEQIAGMSWEYVIQQAPPDKEIWATFTNRAAWSPETLQDNLHEMQERFPEYRHRIARRLVSKPEEIK